MAKIVQEERYARSVQGQISTRLSARLWIGSAGLLEDKKRSRMVIDEKCGKCDSRVGEDVAHFQLSYGEFDRDQQVVLENVCRIMRA